MLVQKLSWIAVLLFLYQHGAEAKRTLTCEGGSAYLRCDLGLIKVLKANYGRTDRTTCASGRPANQISNTHCIQGTSLHTMSTRCDGSKSCSVPAVNSVAYNSLIIDHKILYCFIFFTYQKLCDGSKSCSIPALNSVFGDPCYGTYKYLDVSYECQ
ncbi:hypothetical protein ABG768_002622 [Culter alburnus]|uniref:SUEL-type lectin domain-containing protein n=1 Tax=Culter alburnus TaxID=194366 RepID=A0AAW2A5Y9_CULAL